MRNLMIGIATAGLLFVVAGCSSSPPRYGYAGPDAFPDWRGQNFYSYQNGYYAMNYTNNDQGHQDLYAATEARPAGSDGSGGPSGDRRTCRACRASWGRWRKRSSWASRPRACGP